MEALQHVSGKAYPFGMKNCDTDVIIDAEWLKTISRKGLGQGAFATLRGMPGNVFEDPAYAGSPILIAGDNFGCGSSREHAAWALADMGVKIVIAPSFSDIFAGNAFKNGILTVVLPQDAVETLMELTKIQEISVDLEQQTVTAGTDTHLHFEIDPFRKSCLLNGWDEIALTLSSVTAISRYEAERQAQQAWVFGA